MEIPCMVGSIVKTDNIFLTKKANFVAKEIGLCRYKSCWQI